MIRILIVSLFIASVFGQQCLPGDATGPCGIGGSCPAAQVCITDTPDGVFVCCPFGDIFTTTTPSPACVDKINPNSGTSDCPNIAYLCSNPAYKKLMEEQCPQTCGYCGTGSNTGGSVCQDNVNPMTGTSDCPSRKYLCNDDVYRQLMKEQCPRTCGYC